MSNLRDLATFLYRTGEGRRLIQTLDTLLEVGQNQSKDVFEERILIGSDVSTMEQPVLEKNAS